MNQVSRGNQTHTQTHTQSLKSALTKKVTDLVALNTLGFSFHTWTHKYEIKHGKMKTLLTLSLLNIKPPLAGSVELYSGKVLALYKANPGTILGIPYGPLGSPSAEHQLCTARSKPLAPLGAVPRQIKTHKLTPVPTSLSGPSGPGIHCTPWHS